MDQARLRETEARCTIVDMHIGSPCPQGKSLPMLYTSMHTGQPLPAGQKGEVALTTLEREAMPLLR